MSVQEQKLDSYISSCVLTTAGGDISPPDVIYGLRTRFLTILNMFLSLIVTRVTFTDTQDGVYRFVASSPTDVQAETP